MPSKLKTQSGSSMIEILVALFTLSIGLLGLAGMQSKTLQFNQSAYFKSQATMFAQETLETAQLMCATGSACSHTDLSADWLTDLSNRIPQAITTTTDTSNMACVGVAPGDFSALDCTVTINWTGKDGTVQTYTLWDRIQ